MQRDSDTADSGKPRIVLYCVKRSMGKSVVVHKFEKSIVGVRL